MKVKFNIKNNADRMAICEALEDNGYKCRIVRATEYMPSRMYVEVEVEAYEVEE